MEAELKLITFRIKARDPRQISPFHKNWEPHGTSWVYNETEMEEGFFHHRIGEYPKLCMILGAILVLAEQDTNETEARPPNWRTE